MKKNNLIVIILSVSIMICACFSGAMSVSALSTEGQNLLSELASVGTSIGIDINDFVSVTQTETTTVAQTSEDAKEQLGDFLGDLDLEMSVLAITDMVSYLRSGKTIADWVYENYGDSVEIPESIRTMSTKDVILYLLGVALYPQESTAGESSTSGDYIFVPSETQGNEEITTERTEKETETKTTAVIIFPDKNTETTVMTGDANNDGKVTAADARLILRHSAGIDLLVGDVLYAADTNGDSIVTARDARSVLRYSAGIAKSF